MHKVTIHKTITLEGDETFFIMVGEALPFKIAKQDAEQIISANAIPERNTVKAPNGTVIYVFTTDPLNTEETKPKMFRVKDLTGRGHSTTASLEEIKTWDDIMDDTELLEWLERAEIDDDHNTGDSLFTRI